jgi:hypothetical protein
MYRFSTKWAGRHHNFGRGATTRADLIGHQRPLIKLPAHSNADTYAKSEHKHGEF